MSGGEVWWRSRVKNTPFCVCLCVCVNCHPWVFNAFVPCFFSLFRRGSWVCQLQPAVGCTSKHWRFQNWRGRAFDGCGMEGVALGDDEGVSI